MARVERVIGVRAVKVDMVKQARRGERSEPSREKNVGVKYKMADDKIITI